MLPALSQRLLASWPDLNLRRHMPQQLTYIGLRTSVGDGYALFLALADDDPAPCLMVKVARDRALGVRLRHEWDMLHRLHRSHASWLGSSIPIPVALQDIEGSWALVITAPLGRPMQPRVAAAEGHLARVTDWLVQVASATRSSRPLAATGRSLERMVDKLATAFPLSTHELVIVNDWVAQWLRLVADDKAVNSLAHNSLRSADIWLSDGRLVVINWEWSRFDCLPLRDLFSWITTYYFPASERGSVEDYLHLFRATYLSDGSYASLVGRTINTFCRALTIPAEGAEACLGLYLVEEALRENERLLMAADRGYVPLLTDVACPTRRPYREAVRDQVWINLVRLLVQEHGHFRPGLMTLSKRQFYPLHKQPEAPGTQREPQSTPDLGPSRWLPESPSGVKSR